MLGTQVAGTFLQLAPGSTAQLTRNNPLLTKDAIAGEYSPEVSIMYTEENSQALGINFNYYTRRQKTTEDATLYDGTARFLAACAPYLGKQSVWLCILPGAQLDLAGK